MKKIIILCVLFFCLGAFAGELQEGKVYEYLAAKMYAEAIEMQQHQIELLEMRLKDAEDRIKRMDFLLMKVAEKK
jgi:hypothetical protein